MLWLNSGVMKLINEAAGWWSPGEFCFHPVQTKWYLECYEIMARGDWPVDPNRVRSETLSPHGYFETPEAVWIEFLPRFQSTERDGELAIDLYAYQKELGRLAQIYNCSYDKIGKRARRVVKYISGLDRKETTYREYYQHKRSGCPMPKAKHREWEFPPKENLGGG